MEEHVTARQFMAYYVGRRGITLADLNVAPTVVLSWTLPLQPLAERAGAVPSEHWVYGRAAPLYTGTIAGKPVSFTRARIGAPATVLQVEELLACGARTFIGLGFAGSLQPHIPADSLLLPTTCIREEGTSAHYLPADVPVGPAPWLVNALARACRALGHGVHAGPHWTTDAVYRELRSKVADYRQRGVLGVDMETSAVYAVAQFRGAAAACLLVASDELWHEWRPAFYDPEVTAAGQVATAAVLNCLEEL